MKKPSVKTIRNKCDALLTPIVKKLHPRCLLCGAETQVAHHHIHKSKSSALRYELDNLINLCHHCHCALHNNESYYASVIVKLKGLKWFSKLERIKNSIVKTDLGWYLAHYDRLSKMLSTVMLD